MASIPTYGGPQVQDKPLDLPNTKTDVPLSALGGGEAAEGATAQEVGLALDVRKEADRKYQENYQNAINLQGLEISNQLTAEATRAKNALAQRQGKDAIGGREDTLAGYDKFYQDIEKNIPNDDVKRMAYAHFLQHKQGLDAFATPYEAGQLKEYDNNELTSAMKVQQESAGTDPTPANVSVASMSQKLALEEYAKRNGKGPEWLVEKQQEAGSTTHLEALKSLAAAKQYGAVKEFYAANEREFVGNDKVMAQSIVQQSTTLGDAYALSDAVMAKNPETIGEAMTSLDGMTKSADPEVRHHAEQLLARRYELVKAGQKEATDKTFQDASKLINQPENFGKLPWEVIDPATWLALPDDDRKRLIASSYALMKPMREEDDYQGVTAWNAMTQDQIAQMSPGDMERWRSRLTGKNFDKFAESWGKIRKGEDDLSLKTTHEDRQYFFTAAKNDGRFDLKGVDTLSNIAAKNNVDKSKAFESAFKDIQGIMDAEQKTKGKKLTQIERESIIDKYILSKPKPPGFFGRIFGVTPDEQRVVNGIIGGSTPYGPGGVFGPPDLNKIDLGEAERQRINQTIKRVTGKDASESKILELKRAEQMGATPAELRRIISQ